MDCLGGHGWPPMSERIKICRLFMLKWRDDHFTTMNESLRDPEREHRLPHLLFVQFGCHPIKKPVSLADNNNPVHSQLFD